MSLLGIDIGTTGSKAVVFNHSGEILASCYREYPLYIPEKGQCELDPEEVWKAVQQVVLSTARKVRKKDPVQAIGISTLGDSVTPIDRNGNALARTVIGAADRRAVEQASWIEEHYGRKAAFDKTGTPLHAFCTLPKVMWFREHRPDIYEKAWKFTGWQEIFHVRLGLNAVMDYSLASHTMLMNIHTKKYIYDLLHTCSIDVEKFFPLSNSSRIAGRIDYPYSAQLGVNDGTAVGAGGFDQCCSALGAGVLEPDTAALSVGTLEAITALSNECRLEPSLLEGNYGLSFHIIDSFYIILGFVTTSGAILRWYRDTLGSQEVTTANARNLNPYDVMIESTSEKPSSVYVMPYFAGAGTPWLDAMQKGSVFGLSLDTDRNDIVKGILDCICYEVRLNLESLGEAGFNIRKLRAMGGGSKSERWMQLKADITGKPVEVTEVSEAGCLGAAFLAGQGIGVYTSPQDILEIAKVKKIFEPKQSVFKQYEDSYHHYKELRSRIKGLVL